MSCSKINNCLVIDTNVIISSLISKHANSATKLTMKKAFDGGHYVLYSRETLEEYLRILRLEKFHFDTKVVHQMIRDIYYYGIKIIPDDSGAKLPDPTDKPFYDLVTTKSAGVPLLITGNLRHYPRVRFVLSPRAFCRLAQN